MWQMVKYELEKICSRKIVWIGLLCILGFNLIELSTSLKYQYEVITSDGRVLEGKEGKAYAKERVSHYAGPLTEEKKEEILRTERAANIEEDSFWNSLWLYLSMEDKFESKYSDFYGQTVDEVYTDRGIQVEVGNAGRWMGLFYSYFQMVMFLGCVIVIGVSGVFSEEYSRKTDAILLTSKYGKTKCARAKILASFLFSAGCYGALLLLNAVLFLLDDGISGWNAGVQLDWMNGLHKVDYTLNCGSAAILLAVCGFLAMLMLAGVVLLVSVYCKTPFISIIVSTVLYFLPLFLSSVVPMRMICLTPLGALTIQPFLEPKFSIGNLELLFHVKILIVTVILAAAAWIGAKRVFARHQVM